MKSVVTPRLGTQTNEEPRTKPGRGKEPKTELEIPREAAVYRDMLPLLVPISHITGMRPKAIVASKLKLLSF